MHPSRLAVPIAICLLAAACAPQKQPSRAPRPQASGAGSTTGTTGLTASAERPKRTGLHPELFDEYEPVYAPPTPTATATPEIPSEPETLVEAAPEDLSPPRGESLDSMIASAGAPNVAAALRLVEQGRQLIEQGRPDAAIDPLERAVSIDPASAQGYYYLAVLHYDRANYSQALAFANRAVVLANSGGHGWTARAYVLQATILERVGRYPDARTAYSRALDSEPANVSARVGLARLGGADAGNTTP